MDINRFFGRDDNPGGLRNYLIRGTAGVFVLQIMATGLGFVTNILLARFLGATGYGVYSYIFAWLGLLMVVSMFGFGRLLVREIASYQTSSSLGLIHGLLRFVGTRSFLISIAVALITWLATWLFKGYLDPQIFPAFWIALTILPFLTLSALTDSTFQGFKNIILGRIPQVLIRLPLFIILILVVYWLNPQGFDAIDAVGLTFVSIAVSFFVGVWLLYRIIPKQILREVPEYAQHSWLQSALPLLLVAILFEINTRASVIILGTLQGPEAAGIFGVATLITGLISFILISANAALSPVISSLYTAKDMVRLQKIVTRSARLTFIIALGFAVGLLLFRHQLLLIFGQEFQQSSSVVLILTLGQLVSVASGSVGVLLVMTGYEKNTLVAIAIASVATVGLNLILVPPLGIEGSAIATTTSMILWNVILIVQVIRLLKIDPTLFGSIKIHV